jgi:hypothetical protein
MAEYDLVVTGVVEPGFGYASGARSEKYPEGTINLQRPHFAERGLDISHCFAGTINLSIAPRRFRIRKPDSCCGMCRGHRAAAAEFLCGAMPDREWR